MSPPIPTKTNAESIARLHGDESDDWVGKWITLYHDETVSFGNRSVGGVRVRDEIPQDEIPDVEIDESDRRLQLAPSMSLRITNTRCSV